MSATETLTLTDFLLARIAEDEAVAREPHESVRAVRVTDMERVEWDDSCGYARLGLGRILAECEAKRRIVAMHTEVERSINEEWSESEEGEMSAAWAAMTHLAAVYADHPDYDEAWRP